MQVIGISMDDNAAPARKLVARMKLTYPVAMDDARLGERYGGVLGSPLSFLIDRRGVARARFQGETDLSVIEKEARTLLADAESGVSLGSISRTVSDTEVPVGVKAVRTQPFE